MGFRLAFAAILLLGASACKGRPTPAADEAVRQRALTALASAAASSASNATAGSAAPVNSQVVAFEQRVQATKLSLPPERAHSPRLAFGKAAFAQLTEDALELFDASDFHRLSSTALAGPRAVLTLPDGSLLALGEEGALHWAEGWKQPKPLPRPLLLPGVSVFADSQRADRVWVYEPASGASTPARLSEYVLAAGDSPLLLPEQSLELGSVQPSLLGRSREGVWLFISEEKVERYSPGGLRLPALRLPSGALPTWALPSRRIDQALWLDAAGDLSRVLVSPVFKRLSRQKLPERPFAADVGDDGRLLAVVGAKEPGPRFELLLFDQDLELKARIALPADVPSGRDDWVAVVTANESVVADPRSARVAVGGPDRFGIFDAQGRELFSKPSR